MWRCFFPAFVTAVCIFCILYLYFICISVWESIAMELLPSVVSRPLPTNSLNLWKYGAHRPKTHSAKYTPPNTKIHSLACFLWQFWHSIIASSLSLSLRILVTIWKNLPCQKAKKSQLVQKISPIAAACQNVNVWKRVFLSLSGSCNINGASYQKLAHHCLGNIS